MQYAKTHPDRARTLVIDAVAPASLRLPLPFAEDMDASLKRVARRCREDEACNQTFGDPLLTLKRFLDSLPEKRSVTHPRTGLRKTMEVSPELLTQLLRGPLYATDLQGLLPFAIAAASQGNLGPLLSQAALMEQGGELSLGVLLSVTCAEDIPRIRPEEIVPATEGTVLGDTVVRDFLEACRIWNVPTSPLNLGPLPPNIPVLSLSGEVDPVTPVRWADAATEGVQTHHRVLMPLAGHGILARGCVPRLIASFLDAPTSALDASCVNDETPPSFFLDAAGGAP